MNKHDLLMARNASAEKQTDLIRLDFSKAFDKVTPQALLEAPSIWSLSEFVPFWVTQTMVLDDEESSSPTSRLPRVSVMMSLYDLSWDTFTQVLGFDVCPINSVQLSNHTGYSHFKGQVLNADDAECLYEGLKLNSINGQFSHLLTGYVGSKSFLEKVADIIQDLRKCNPALIYVCDPVMGDNGKMYVPPELMPIYRDVVVPLADIVTPNQFEIELLTGMTIATQADALKAMQILHDKGPTTVVLSSTNLGAEGVLLGLASTVKNGKKECYRVEMPYLQAIFVGTGDLFASCLLAWMHKDNDLKSALEKTVSTVQAVIKRTLQSAKDAAGAGNKPTVAQMELRLIQAKTDIESPKITFTATQLS